VTKPKHPKTLYADKEESYATPLILNSLWPKQSLTETAERLNMILEMLTSTMNLLGPLVICFPRLRAGNSRQDCVHAEPSGKEDPNERIYIRRFQNVRISLLSYCALNTRAS
jgi:hypothetical protein